MTEPEQPAPGDSQHTIADASHQSDPGVPPETNSGVSHGTSSAVPYQTDPGASYITDSSATPHTDPDIRRRRLLFRATHRGTFENDLMIGAFVRAHLANLTEPDLDALESVMEMPDTDLADWLTGRVPIPPEEATPMLHRMREFLTPKRRGTGGVQT